MPPLFRPRGPSLVVVLGNLLGAALIGAVLLGSTGQAPVATEGRLDPPGGSSARPSRTDHHATAVEASRQSFRSGPVRVAFVVTGSDSRDASTARAAAAVLGGPVLPVTEDGIPAPVRRELRRLEPARIIVLGGPDAVSSTTAEALQSYTDGSVTRIAGTDRFATAAAAATTLFTAPVPQVLVVVDDAAAPEPVPLAAPGVIRPVLLVTPAGVPSQTAQALRALRPRSIAVLGKASDALLAELRTSTAGPVTQLQPEPGRP